MKRILIPTDFSSCAKNALKIGATMASTTGSEILLVHILYSPLGLEKLSPRVARYPEVTEALADAKEALKKEMKNPALKGIKVESMIEIGAPAPLILAKAKSWKADLLVIGLHGMEESTHPFVGSNAQKILRGAECPVLSVKADHSMKELRNIIFASNFEEMNPKAFEKVLGIAKALDAKIKLLHVNTVMNFKNTNLIHSQIDSFEKTFPDVAFSRTLYSDNDIHSGISNYLKQNSQGIVALITRARNKQPSYTLGVTEGVAFHSSVPVLSVNTTR